MPSPSECGGRRVRISPLSTLHLAHAAPAPCGAEQRVHPTRALILFARLICVVRVTRVKPKNETERRMGEALSNENWGASSTLLNEIAQDTFD